MARDLIRFSNDKKGFLKLLAVETLFAVWALSATIYAVVNGRWNAALYGTMTALAACYILGRSLRSYRKLAREEREKTEKEDISR